MGARNFQRAKDFATKHGIQKAYGEYEAIASDPDVEIVYVGVTAPEHYNIVKIMLEAGKNVLCEKPLGVSLEQVQELINLAKSKNLFFMQAIWSRTFPLYEELKKQFVKIGEVSNLSGFEIDKYESGQSSNLHTKVS